MPRVESTVEVPVACEVAFALSQTYGELRYREGRTAVRPPGGTFTCKPRLLQPIAHPIGRWLLGRDIQRRIEAFADACADPSILTELETHPVADLAAPTTTGDDDASA